MRNNENKENTDGNLVYEKYFSNGNKNITIIFKRCRRHKLIKNRLNVKIIFMTFIISIPSTFYSFTFFRK